MGRERRWETQPQLRDQMLHLLCTTLSSREGRCFCSDSSAAQEPFFFNSLLAAGRQSCAASWKFESEVDVLTRVPHVPIRRETRCLYTLTPFPAIPFSGEAHWDVRGTGWTKNTSRTAAIRFVAPCRGLATTALSRLHVICALYFAFLLGFLLLNGDPCLWKTRGWGQGAAWRTASLPWDVFRCLSPSAVVVAADTLTHGGDGPPGRWPGEVLPVKLKSGSGDEWGCVKIGYGKS